MMNDIACRRIAFALGIAGLASCGGGGGSRTTPGTIATTSPAVNRNGQTVPVTFTIKIPRPTSGSSRRAQYISASTASATITINAGAPTSVPCTTVCTVTVNAPVGSDTFMASLYDGSANLLSQGSVVATISPTIANVVNIAFGGQVAQIVLSGTIANLVPGTLATNDTITIVTKDADNNTIVGTDPYANPITLTDTDGSGATGLSLTSITSPATSSVTFSYNGAGALAGSAVTITPTAAGSAGNVPVAYNVYAHHTFLEYAVAGAIHLDGLATGSDGNVWFIDQNVSSVGKITPAGVISQYATGGGAAYIALGSDGNMWFTEFSAVQIGRVTPAGVVTEFGGLTPSSQPEGIALGPGGNMYFAEFGAGASGRLGEITTAGAVTESAQLAGPPQIQGVAVGSDARMWVTEPFGGSGNIDAFNTASPPVLQNQYATPGGSQLRDLVNGSDNNLWIIDSGNGEIAQLTIPGHVFTEYPILGSGLTSITAGVDGQLWYAEFSTNSIGSMTTAGVAAHYVVTSGNAPWAVTSGPDGNIWFTEFSNAKIGRFIL